MRQFFRTRRFKVMLCIAGALILIMIVTGAVTGWMAPQSNVIGAVITPVQKFFTGVSNSISEVFAGFGKTEELRRENEELREEIREKTQQLIDYEKLQQQNEFYKDYLKIKDENPDFTFVHAMMIGDDPLDSYGSFTIDKGTLHGISPKDTVITADGLVGYIYEAGPNYATVATILNPQAQVGAYDNRTRDAGVAEGRPELAEQGLCRLSYLKRSAGIRAGDMILTSGVGGLFPDGLLVGRVREMGQDPGQVTVYAVVEPAARLSEIREVMVITSFEGQGDFTTQQEDQN